MDIGKTIPKSPVVGTPVTPAGQWRLYELFVQSFHTWLWDADNAKYGKEDKPEAVVTDRLGLQFGANDLGSWIDKVKEI